MRLVLVLLVALAGAVWGTWPLALHLPDATLSRVDPWPAAWQIHWLHRALLEAPWAWADANIYFPYQNSLGGSDLLATHALVTLPLMGASGPLLAYNVALLLGFVISAVAAYLLIRELAGDGLAAVAAALAFGLSPFRFQHVPHLSIVGAWATPLFLWTLARHFRAPTWSRAALAAAAGVLVPASSLYHGLYLAALLPLVLVALWRHSGGGLRAWRPLLGTGAIASLPLLVMAMPYWEHVRHFGYGFSEDESVRYGADLAGLLARPHYLAPPTEWAGTGEAHIYPGLALLVLGIGAAATRVHDLWRDRLGRALVSVFGLGLGLALVGTALPRVPASGAARVAGVVTLWTLPLALAFDACRRRGDGTPGFALRLGLAGAVTAFLLSFGTELRFLGEPLGPGPFTALGWVSGVYRGVRVPARFAGIAILFLAVAGGAWLVRLQAAGRLGRKVALALCALAILATLTELPEPRNHGWLSPAPSLDDPAYEWLASQPEDFGILELPENGNHATWERSRYMLASRHHWKHLVNGTSPYSTMPTLARQFFHIPPWTSEFFRFIRSYLPVRFILVHEEAVPGRVRARFLSGPERREEGWRLVRRFGRTSVFDLDRSREEGSIVDRLFLRERLSPRAEVRFALRVSDGHGPLRVRVSHDGEELARVPVDREWSDHRFELAVAPIAPLQRAPWPRSGTLVRLEAAGDGRRIEVRGLHARRIR